MTARLFRAVIPLALLAAAAVALSGCSGQVQERANATPPHVVTIEGPITDHDADLLSASWAGWEKANHITILYTGTPDFESGDRHRGAAEQRARPRDLRAAGHRVGARIARLPAAVARRGHRKREQELPGDLGAIHDHQRHQLRGAAAGERQRLGVLLAEAVREVGRLDSEDLGRPARADRAPSSRSRVRRRGATGSASARRAARTG